MTTFPAEELAPQRIKMSYEEYLATAGDAEIMEWVDGEVICYMPPLLKHQRLAFFLGKLLDSFVDYFNLGVVMMAPFEVKLWPDGPSREPDVLFVSESNLSGLTEARFTGGPDLLIEIISRSSITEDRVRKFEEYEQANVREYWIIDPRPHQQQADFYVLSEDSTFHAAPIDEDGIYHSHVLPGFWLQIGWLWQEPLPASQLALAEIMLSVPDLPSEAKETYHALYQMLLARKRSR